MSSRIHVGLGNKGDEEVWEDFFSFFQAFNDVKYLPLGSFRERLNIQTATARLNMPVWCEI